MEVNYFCAVRAPEGTTRSVVDMHILTSHKNDHLLFSQDNFECNIYGLFLAFEGRTQIYVNPHSITFHNIMRLFAPFLGILVRISYLFYQPY